MEKNRADNKSKESGIALVMALVITVVVMMLIASLTYLFTKGFQTNIINRKFSTVYEAANGGVEYTTGIMNSYLKGTTPENVGSVAVTGGSSLNAIATCIDQVNAATITAKTADGTYKITTTFRCLGSQIPSGNAAFRFPPPPPVAGGGTGTGNMYYFYSIIAQATETSGSTNIGRTEAVYRALLQ